MKLTKRERESMVGALTSAIAWEYSYIESHWDTAANKPMATFKGVVQRSRKNIERYTNLRLRLMQEPRP